jgi:hypothetical protein
MGYELHRATIEQLYKRGRSGQPSMDALRARAREHILVYLDSEGPTRFFDEQLSEIRLQAAAQCRAPGVTWKMIGTALKALDKQGLNERLKNQLTRGSNAQATKFLCDRLDSHLS